MLLIRLALRNVRRNTQRTFFTALTVALCTGLLTLGLSWIHGILGSLIDIYARFGGHVRVTTMAYADREALFPLHAYMADVDDLAREAEALPGVEAAYPRILAGVTLTTGDEIGDMFGLVMGLPPAWYEQHGDFDAWLGEGRTPTKRGEAVLGSKLASVVDARVGDEVLLVGQTQDGAPSPIEVEVVGVVSVGTSAVDQLGFLVLEDLQWMADIEGSTELLVYGEDPVAGTGLARALREHEAFGSLRTEAWDQRDVTAGLLPVVKAIQGIFAAVLISVSALGMWNTMMMSVLERTGEIGVLRAMGLGRLGVVALFVMEGMTIAALGGLVGMVWGGLAGLWLETYGVEMGDYLAQNADLPMRTTMYADVSVEVLLAGFVLGMCVAWVGTALPAWRAASIQPVEAMRSER